MLQLYLNMLMILKWCLLLVINVIRLLTLWDISWDSLKGTTCLAIQKNVKNLSSEVEAKILNTTPHLIFLNAVVLFYWGGGGVLRSRAIVSFGRTLISN